MAAEEKRNELLETLSWVKQQSPSLHASNTFRSLERQLTSLLGKYQVAEAGHGDAGVLAEVYNDRGHARYMQVDFNGALDDFNRALVLHPRLAAAFYNRGTVEYRMGRFANALKDLQEACQICPENAEFQEGRESCQKALVEVSNNSD